MAQRLDAPRVLIDVDREKSAEAGLTAREVLVQTAAVLNPTLPADHPLWTDKTGKFALEAPFHAGPGRRLEDVLNVFVRGAREPDRIKLGSVVRLQGATTAVEINHVNLVRTVNILVNHAAGGDALRLAGDIETNLRGLAIPEGMEVAVKTPARRAP